MLFYYNNLTGLVPVSGVSSEQLSTEHQENQRKTQELSL